MLTLRFASQWSPAIMLLAACAFAALAWWLYRRELRGLSLGTAHWILPTLRAAAIFLIILTLAEPSIEMRQREGQPGRILILLDASESMAMLDATDADAAQANLVGTMSRYQRATQDLIDPLDGLLTQLGSEFEISVQQLTTTPGGDASSVTIWKRNLEHADELPVSTSDWLPESWTNGTAIGAALLQASDRVKTQAPDGATASAVVVLLSDGQSNSGVAPLEAVDKLGDANIKLFCVGYGPSARPLDLALQSINTPQRIDRSDILQGTLIVSDELAVGTPMQAKIFHGEEMVWSQDLVAEGQGRREIQFQVPIEPRFEIESRELPPGFEFSTLPMKLTARLTAETIEANTLNNEQVFHISVASQKSQVLLVDGRSRWETRYLRNLFARDPGWEVVTVLSSQDNAAADDSDILARLPDKPDALEKINLVILGDTPSDLWSDEQLEGLNKYVELGGGLVIIDGARGHLREPRYEAIAKLLPVAWKPAADNAAIEEEAKKIRLTASARNLEALQLATGEDEQNASVWEALPGVRFLSSVETLPGAETLLEASAQAGSRPLLVTRRFGAGRVLFLATDESWRWRYKVADLIHQRFWNQLARWAMREPMSVQGEFVSLDTGPASVEQNEPSEIRCSLRNLDGSMADGKSVFAIVRSQGKVIARIPLVVDEERPGFYTAMSSGLAPGDYQVQIEAAGYPREVLDVESRFTVLAARSLEMQEPAQNVALLQELSERAGGIYVPEQRSGELIERLRPMSGGRITQSATLLWQSYWWFVAALLLLIAEWVVRKRNGLV